VERQESQLARKSVSSLVIVATTTHLRSIISEQKTKKIYAEEGENSKGYWKKKVFVLLSEKHNQLIYRVRKMLPRLCPVYFINFVKGGREGEGRGNSSAHLFSAKLKAQCQCRQSQKRPK